jgi:transketolase
MRALPRMTVTAVCDAEEMTRLMDATLDWPHPIYIRLGKGGDPVISKPERGFAIGKAIDMIDGETGASDVLLIATGVATTQALKARARWRRTASAAACCTSTPSSQSTPTPSSTPQARPGWSSPSRSTASSAVWAAPSWKPCRTV